jgi:hypothetical protein
LSPETGSASNHGARLEPSEGQWRINFLPAVLTYLHGVAGPAAGVAGRAGSTKSPLRPAQVSG